jgi:DNA-binding beta-propeller fold protein YncE
MRSGIEHSVVNDSSFQVWSQYNVSAWPTVVLVDPNGRIAGETSGEIQAEDFASLIESILQDHHETIDRTPLELLPEIQQEPRRSLHFPAKLLIAGDNTLFIADTGHHRVIEVKLDPGGLNGQVERVFGRAQPGMQDGAAREAAFYHPHGLALGGDPASGTLYIADTGNHAVRAVDLRSGAVRTLAGTGQKAHGRFPLRAPTETPLRSPWDVLALDRYLFIAMAGSHQLWVLVDEERLGPFAGNGAEALVDGPLAECSFNQPSGLAFGDDRLFVADAEASAVRAVILDEEPHTDTLVGTGLFDFGDLDGRGEQVMLQHPTEIDYAAGVLFIADTFNHKIKVIDPDTAETTTLIGTGDSGHRDGRFDQAQLYEPEGVQVQPGPGGQPLRLYIADTNNHVVRVADIETGVLHTLVLRGLENLPQAPAPHRLRRRLPPVQASPVRMRLVLDFELPEGFELSPDNPARIYLADAPAPLFFAHDEEIALDLQPAALAEVDLDVTLYYCREGEGGLCRVQDLALTLPLHVEPDGPDEIRILLEINEKEIDV